MFAVFLSSYRNTRRSLGELEKAVETHNISHSSKLPLVLCFVNSIAILSHSLKASQLFQYLSILFIGHFDTNLL